MKIWKEETIYQEEDKSIYDIENELENHYFGKGLLVLLFSFTTGLISYALYLETNKIFVPISIFFLVFIFSVLILVNRPKLDYKKITTTTIKKRVKK